MVVLIVVEFCSFRSVLDLQLVFDFGSLSLNVIAFFKDVLALESV